MAKIRRNEKRDMPALNTSSLPDIIFMLLFFFMSVTTMKEVTYKVQIKNTEATQLTKIEKKSATRYIYVGEPTYEFKQKYGTETRIQLDDAFAEVDEVGTYISSEWNLMEGEDKKEMTVCIKADKKTKMKVITDIKSKLREVNALRINYAALEPVKKGN
jgi:biopolymer transport protein ExbD